MTGTMRTIRLAGIQPRSQSGPNGITVGCGRPICDRGDVARLRQVAAGIADQAVPPLALMHRAAPARQWAG